MLSEARAAAPIDIMSPVENLAAGNPSFDSPAYASKKL